MRLPKALAMVASLALAACASTAVEDAPPPAPETPPPGGAVSRFTCDGGDTLEAVFVNGGESVRVTASGSEPVTLPRVESGSGFSYASRSTMFFGKGDEVRFQVVGGKDLTCRKAPRS